MFFTFLLCAVAATGCLRGSSHLAPIQQHPAEPRKGFSHQGEEWGSPGLWVLNGPHWSRGHCMDPSRVQCSCGNQAFLGSKATRAVQQHPGHCWTRGRTATCPALLHSVLCQRGAVGGSASQQDLTLWSPCAQCSHPGKGSPALSMQLPWELLWFEQHQSHPCLGRSDQAKPSPGIRVVHSDGVHPHLLLPGAGITLSAALTLNHNKAFCDSTRQQ